MVISRQPISCADLMKRFPKFFVESIGDLNRTISGVASPEAASADRAVFLATPKALAQGLASQAGVLIVGKKNRTDAEAARGDRTILIASNVELAMATVVSELFLKTPYTNAAIDGVHPTAFIGEGAEIAKGARVGPHAFIGARVKLASGVYIGANAVLEDDVSVDEGSVIHPLVFIGHSTQIGKRCEVHPNTVIAKEGYGYVHDERFNHYRIPHQGRVVLEDDVHIGGGCAIDRATFDETRIGAGTKFDNKVHIAHNNKIGRNSLITAGFLMAGSSKIGANFVTGGNSVVTGHIEVADNVQIAAASGISKDLKEPGQYGGLPLVPLQQHIKIKAALVHLPEMRKQLKSIMKKLGIEG